MSDRVDARVYALQGATTCRGGDREPRPRTELCRKAAADHYDVVVAFGGDGTVNEAANGLAGSRTALTCLPGGSNNVVAKLLGIPTDVVDATEHLLELADRWQPRQVDLGVVNERMFTFSSGMGLDAAVVERVDGHPHLKSRFGPWYFVEAAVSTFLRQLRRQPAAAGGRGRRPHDRRRQRVHPERRSATRTSRTGRSSWSRARDSTPATWPASCSHRARPYDVPTVTFRALSGAARIAKHKGIAGFAGAKEIVVRSTDGRTIPVHVDGDHILDTLEARFSIVPGALQVVS
jgi:diacylglycerol kinase family enzyme